ncbi:MAG TPA: ABC transporter [Gammaproteobacteria bacterium]|nr:ABC transporter [Gammaproteobacteria bacterium]
MIEVDAIKKKFGDVEAVRNVSFKAQNGQVTGLLGPNGAGKSTTLRILYGLFAADSGSAKVDGIDTRTNRIAAQKIMGIMPDARGLYVRLTAREHIKYFGRLHGMSEQRLEVRTEELLDLLDMQNIADRKVEGFSQGERTKVCLARALVHEPANVILDEPTNGLDVMTTRAVRELITELKRQNIAVLFSSHLMHEVARLCDEIIIVASGAVVATGSAEQISAFAQEENLEDAFIKLVESEAMQ